jgi:hypothetical protein
MTSFERRGHFEVLVNSAFRDKTVFPNPNRFTVTLPVVLRDVRGVIVKNFYMYGNEAEYVVLLVKQFKCSVLSSPVESQWQLPTDAIHISETSARETVGRGMKYLNSSVADFCFDTPIGSLKQLDIEVYGRLNVGHVLLAAPTPMQLFPFTVPDHEWAALLDFDCHPGFA